MIVSYERISCKRKSASTKKWLVATRKAILQFGKADNFQDRYSIKFGFQANVKNNVPFVPPAIVAVNYAQLFAAVENN